MKILAIGDCGSMDQYCIRASQIYRANRTLHERQITFLHKR